MQKTVYFLALNYSNTGRYDFFLTHPTPLHSLREWINHYTNSNSISQQFTLKRDAQVSNRKFHKNLSQIKQKVK